MIRFIVIFLLIPSLCYGQHCGTERWSIKTGTDAGARAVDTAHPHPTTVGQLTRLIAPSPLPIDRYPPVEDTVYLVEANLTFFKHEADQDFHLVLEDDGHNSMIAEIPAPACAAHSAFLRQIKQARRDFMARVKSKSDLPLRVRITGVGFFDFQHHQTGVAPNAIELHPVLKIEFLPDLTN